MTAVFDQTTPEHSTQVWETRYGGWGWSCQCGAMGSGFRGRYGSLEAHEAAMAHQQSSTVGVSS